MKRENTNKNMKKIKVLIADDDPMILMVMKEQLRDQGFEVLTAADGKEACDKIHNQRPDMIITDMFMPFHNGQEVIQFAKKELGQGVPVIAISANDSEIIGVDDFIPKYFLRHELPGLGRFITGLCLKHNQNGKHEMKAKLPAKENI